MRFKGMTLFIYIVIAGTGATGLIYQVAWQKYLSRILGSDSVATAIILATFLGGLSLGYYVCGKLTLRVKNHFRGYALLEGIIGIWCLFFPFIFKAVDHWTAEWSFAQPVLIVIQGVFTSLLLTGVPTLCMGGTIPFLTRGISRNITEASQIHARVYAINTGGAFVGTLLAGFFLIPYLGLPVTVCSASSINFLALVFFYMLSRAPDAPSAAQDIEADTGPSSPSPASGGTVPASNGTDLKPSPYPPLVLYTVALLSGIYVMILENVLIRLTQFSIGGSSYAFSIIVSVFILSIAIGSHLVGRCKSIPRNMLFLNQFFIAVLLLLLYLTLDVWPYVAHLVRIAFQVNRVAFWGYYLGVLIVLTATLIVPVSLMGATVPITFHEIKRSLAQVGKHSGQLFSWNTFGSLLGSLIGGIVLYSFLNMEGIFLVAALLAALSAALVGQYLSLRYMTCGLMVIVVAAGFFIFTPFFTQANFKRGTFRERLPLPCSFAGPKKFFETWNANTELLFYDEDATAIVSVVESELEIEAGNKLKERAIIINGKSDSATLGDTYTLKLLAHLPGLLSARQDECMIIGLGTGITAGELALNDGVKHIDVVEISPSVIEALPLFKEANYNLHENEIVEFHIGDAFRILRRSDKKYDLIISEPSNPWVMGVDLLYTREFYNLVCDHLTEEGVLTQWIHVYAANPTWVAMIANTLQGVFGNTRTFMVNNGDLIILASKKPITEEILDAAEVSLQTNSRLRESLAEVSLDSLDKILIREIWTSEFIRKNFSRFGEQTMDLPKLHYMAGMSFFKMESVPLNFLLHHATSSYEGDYLFALREGSLSSYPESMMEHYALIESLKDKLTQLPLPMVQCLKIRAYLNNSVMYSLSDAELDARNAALIPLVAGLSKSDDLLEQAGLKNASIREKAKAYLDHLYQFSDWIAVYPLYEVKSLLLQGIERTVPGVDRNWFILHYAVMLIKERAGKDEVEEFLKKAVRDSDGIIMVNEEDEVLREGVLLAVEAL